MEEIALNTISTPKALLKQQLKKGNPDFRYYKSLFNITSNFVAITEGDTVIDANKPFIDFFMAQNIDVFDPHFLLSQVFQKINKYGYVYDGYQNQRWFNLVDKKKKDYYRVGIISSKKVHEFNISIEQFESIENVFIVIMTDISELMGYKNVLEYNLRSISKNEEEAQFLLKEYNNAIDMSNLVIKMDCIGNITYINNAFCEALKYSQDELVGKSIKILCNTDETCKCYSSIIQTIKSGEIYKGVIENIDKENDIHFFSATVVPIKNQSGTVVECISIQNEITEMVKAKEDALHALEIKTKFFDKVSHEFRTPLNAILNFTDQAVDAYDEILDNEESREMVKMFIQRAHKNSQTLLNLINSLLDLSKLKSANEHFNIAVYDVVKLTREAYENCSSLNTKGSVDYRLKINFDFGLIRCDNIKFNQVLINLISNAFKFTQDGLISVNLSEIEDAYLVEIEDSGIGIPSKKLSSIFEPFEQARDSDIGTGLGLSITKEYTNAMNMVLDVTSSDGVGSCFRLIIKKI